MPSKRERGLFRPKWRERNTRRMHRHIPVRAACPPLWQRRQADKVNAAAAAAIDGEIYYRVLTCLRVQLG